VINRFRATRRRRANVLDPRPRKTIKEFSAIDGAFLIRGDGVILNAGRLPGAARQADDPCPQGLGAATKPQQGIT